LACTTGETREVELRRNEAGNIQGDTEKMDEKEEIRKIKISFWNVAGLDDNSGSILRNLT